MEEERKGIRGTTILCLRRGEKVVLIGDGQITLGHTVMKGTANKLRTLGNGKIITGFAGSTADAFALFGLLEEKLEKYAYNLRRASVEMAKEWRTDRRLRKLESMLIASDKKETFLISGAGDVIDPEDGVTAIGSGGAYALAAARALLHNSPLPLREVAEKAMAIAAAICIYTNTNFSVLELGEEQDDAIKST